MTSADAFTRLVDIMARLRAPGGCPWDREQSRESLRPYLIEEAYEALDAIDSGNVDSIRDELGDVLLQVVFHARIAAERGEFDVADVCRAVSDKLERRHPHVFGNVSVRDSEEVLRNWAAIKARERRDRGDSDSAVAGLPASLPALLYAQRLGEKAARVGFDWPSLDGVLAKVREELEELERALVAGDGTAAGDELGDLLFTLASVGRHVGHSAELTLRQAVSRFVARFQEMERQAGTEGAPLAERSAEDLDRLWRAAKRACAKAG
jgi:MazG family protein